MQCHELRRRDFITLLGGAAAWPLEARAQQPGTPVIGFLDGQSFDPYLMTAFRQALKDAGYIEGRTVGIYFRSADGQTDRLVTLAGDIRNEGRGICLSRSEFPRSRDNSLLKSSILLADNLVSFLKASKEAVLNL